MKTASVVLMVTFFSVAGLASCSKKNDDIAPAQSSTPASAQVGFQTKIDGTPYAPDFAYALAQSPGIDKYYAIYGLNSKTSDVVVIALPNTAGEGTYSLNDVNIGVVEINKQDYSTINNGTGTVTITKKTATYITGTFSFSAYDDSGTKKITLTEGKFNVNIR